MLAFIAGITSICGFLGSAAVVGDSNDPSTVFIVIYVKDILARYPVDAVRYYISVAGP